MRGYSAFNSGQEVRMLYVFAQLRCSSNELTCDSYYHGQVAPPPSPPKKNSKLSAILIWTNSVMTDYLL